VLFYSLIHCSKHQRFNKLTLIICTKHSKPQRFTSFYILSAKSLFSNHNVIKILMIIDASLKGTIIAETLAARSFLLLETQQLLERPPEVQVEDGVDDWIEGGVDVAQPRHKV
jgi:hypothetical protein